MRPRTDLWTGPDGDHRTRDPDAFAKPDADGSADSVSHADAIAVAHTNADTDADAGPNAPMMRAVT